MTDNQQPQPGEVWGDPMDSDSWYQPACDRWAIVFGGSQRMPVVECPQNITAIVRQHLADAEPITVERMEAMGAKHEFTNEDDIAEYELLGLDVMVLADGVVRVYGRDAILNPRTMGDLRAALRLLGGES